MILNKALQVYISHAIERFDEIENGRKDLLKDLAEIIQSSSDDVALTFICTHNSRRSHFGQIWAAIAGHYYQIPISTFSGGTEVTAFNKNAIHSFERAGFRTVIPEGTNPKVELFFSESEEPLIAFSKTYDDAYNPKENFIAIMTCDEANEACPVVFGAKQKVALTYQDPKVSDGTPQQNEVYDERCLQIATEMFYLFNTISKSRKN